MMAQRSCCVPGCSMKLGGGLPLHRFPNPNNPAQIERFRTWVMKIGGDIIGEDNGFIHKNRKVCHKHFEDVYIFPNMKLTALAIPTLEIPGVHVGERRHIELPSTPIQMAMASSTRPIPMDTDLSSRPEFCPATEQNEDTHEVDLVCRVCLAMDVKMYDLNDVEMREMFQNITGIAVTENNHPILQRLCWECAGRLKAAAAFRNKAVLSDALLQGLANTGEQIRKHDITLIKDSEDYLKTAATLTVVEAFHTVDIDPENDDMRPLSENNDTKIVQNAVRKDFLKQKNESIIEEHNDQTDVEDESMIEAPINTEMEYDQFDRIRPNTGEENSNVFIETNPLFSSNIPLKEDTIDSANSSPQPTRSHVEPKYPVLGYRLKNLSDCEDKVKKHVIKIKKRDSISKIVSKNSKELISAKSKNMNVKIGGISKKTSNLKLLKNTPVQANRTDEESELGKF